MDKYIQFLENHLGKIQYGWTNNEKGEKLPFQIVKYSKGPFPGTITYSTLGLSDKSLVSPVSGKQILQELIFVSALDFGDRNIPSILQQVGLMALKNKKAYLRGDVIGPYGTLFNNSKLEALYVTMPVYFPETFYTFSIDEKTSIVMAWLVPITLKEANYVSKNGWEKFEDAVENLNPDLIDFNRQSMFYNE